jgi:hypothetical protein
MNNCVLSLSTKRVKLEERRSINSTEQIHLYEMAHIASSFYSCLMTVIETHMGAVFIQRVHPCRVLSSNESLRYH